MVLVNPTAVTATPSETAGANASASDRPRRQKEDSRHDDQQSEDGNRSGISEHLRGSHDRIRAVAHEDAEVGCVVVHKAVVLRHVLGRASENDERAREGRQSAQHEHQLVDVESESLDSRTKHAEYSVESHPRRITGAPAVAISGITLISPGRRPSVQPEQAIRSPRCPNTVSSLSFRRRKVRLRHNDPRRLRMRSRRSGSTRSPSPMTTTHSTWCGPD